MLEVGCVEHEFHAEGTMIKEEVQGYPLPFSGNHVAQISLDVGTSYMAMTSMKFADMVMSYVSYLCALFRSIQYIKFGAIPFAFWLMFLGDRSLAPAITTTAV
jgi:hypothetical protein